LESERNRRATIGNGGWRVGADLHGVPQGVGETNGEDDATGGFGRAAALMRAGAALAASKASGPLCGFRMIGACRSACAAAVLVFVLDTVYAQHLPTDVLAPAPSPPLHPIVAILIVLQLLLTAVLLLEYYKLRRARSESRQQQSELTYAARLVLVGEITGSIVHEVSQPLGAILSNSDAAELLLAADPPRVAEVREILADIKRDDLRAHEIVRNLRSLLRKREVHIEAVDLNEATRGVLKLVQADASRRNVVIRAAFDEQLRSVAADPVHLQQVLLNLIVNAMDAMADKPSNARQLDIQTHVRDAKTAEVAVIDTGHGIEPEQMSKLFESFFTTKPEGMGLGLSIARSIVQAHGGKIWADNTDMGGAAFRFTVPLLVR
jgi:signal transduction histidine kinase